MINDENEKLPARGTAREQQPPEQLPHPLKGQQPTQGDTQEGHMGGTQTGSGPAQTREDRGAQQ